MAEPSESSKQSFFSKLQAWDTKNFYKINSRDSKYLVWLKHFTHIGSIYFWTPSIIILAIISWIVDDPFDTIGWTLVKYLVANLGSIGLFLIVKYKIYRIRPCYALENVNIRTHKRFFKGPSWPSGHVQYFFSNMLVITFIFSNLYKNSFLLPLILLSLISTTLIAISRVYVGVHYPSDVISAFFSGLLLFWITLLVFPIWSFIFDLIDSLVHLF